MSDRLHGSGWFAAPNQVFSPDSGLKAIDQAVLLYLYRCAGPDGCAWPSYATIQKATGLSRPTVIAVIKRLSQTGWISCETRRSSEGDSATNLYRLRIPAIGRKAGSDDEQVVNEIDQVVNDINRGGKAALPRVVNVVDHGGKAALPEGLPNEEQESNNPPSTSPHDSGGRGNAVGDDGERQVKRRRVREQYPSDFERFWSVYPRKVEKRRAFKCWQTRLREGYTADELIRAAEAYAEECRRKGRSQDYIKHASTFLGPSKPFEDYLARASPDTDTGGGLLDWIPEVPFEGEGIGA